MATRRSLEWLDRERARLGLLVLLAGLLGIDLLLGGSSRVQVAAALVVLTLLLLLAVTGTVGASRALRSARARADSRDHLLSAMFAAANVGMALADDERRWLAVNPALCQMLGFFQEELEGRSFDDVTHPDDVALGRQEFQRIQRGETDTAEFEKRYIAHDGEVIWAWVSVAALNDAPSGRRYQVAQIRDITHRKRVEERLRESEERWRTLLAQVEEMVVVIDMSGHVVYASPAVERWLGYDARAVVGNEVTFATHPDHVEALTAALRDVRPGHPVSLTRSVRAADGSWRWCESRVVRLDETDGASLLLISHDVTERIELDHEREQLEMERRVSQRLEAVGQLSAGIAHEINTPLQFVGDSVTFLRDAVDDLLILTGLYRESLFHEQSVPAEERQRAMSEAEEEADVEYLIESIPRAFTRTEDGIERVRTIVQAMKRFSHASATEVAKADINDALRTTLAVCRNEYKYVAQVTTDLDELPLVTCNIGEINQLFLNVILNAAQAIAEKVEGSGGLGRISVSTRVDGQEVVVTIDDDGPGIAPEIRERIYEPFFTTKEVGKGTGQGLALARTTVERHSGSLTCTTAVGEGTTFTIRLPIDPPPDAAPGRRQ